jgi:hypothetical protein
MQCTAVKCRIESAKLYRLMSRLLLKEAKEAKEVESECSRRDSSCLLSKVARTERQSSIRSSSQTNSRTLYEEEHRTNCLPKFVDQFLTIWPSLWPCVLYSASACILQVRKFKDELLLLANRVPMIQPPLHIRSHIACNRGSSRLLQIINKILFKDWGFHFVFSLTLLQVLAIIEAKMIQYPLLLEASARRLQQISAPRGPAYIMPSRIHEKRTRASSHERSLTRWLARTRTHTHATHAPRAQTQEQTRIARTRARAHARALT